MGGSSDRWIEGRKWDKRCVLYFSFNYTEQRWHSQHTHIHPYKCVHVNPTHINIFEDWAASKSLRYSTNPRAILAIRRIGWCFTIFRLLALTWHVVWMLSGMPNILVNFSFIFFPSKFPYLFFLFFYARSERKKRRKGGEKKYKMKMSKCSCCMSSEYNVWSQKGLGNLGPEYHTLISFRTWIYFESSGI